MKVALYNRVSTIKQTNENQKIRLENVLRLKVGNMMCMKR